MRWFFKDFTMILRRFCVDFLIFNNLMQIKIKRVFLGKKNRTIWGLAVSAIQIIQRDFMSSIKYPVDRDREHTAGSDTIFVQIYMDVLPGAPGVSKNHFFFTNKTVEFLR